MSKHSRVACDCNDMRASGYYHVAGDWLVLKSTVGDYRVRLGIADPRKIASKLLKNACLKATRAARADPKPCCASSVSDKARQLVDLQRDRLAAASDPERPREAQMLDQIVANARSIDAASRLLDPPPSSPDASNA